MKINLLFLLLAFIAEIIGTVGGFGSSVFFVPIGNFYFDFHTVLGLTAVFHVFSNLSKIVLFKQGLDKKLLLNIGVPSIIFVVIGGILSNYIESHFLEVFLGIFLVVLSLVFLIRRNLIIPPSKRNSILGGSLSGLSAGLLGTGGAIRGLTMAAFNMEKSIYIATSAAIDFMIDFSRTVVYFGNGYIKKEVWFYLPFLLIIGFTGTYVGKRLLKYLPESRFKQFSLILILLIGIITLLKFVVEVQ